MPSNEDKIREKKDTFIQKLKEDGVVNPQGFALVGTNPPRSPKPLPPPPH